jgi:7-keto-8-aminopelargonate synthetase-like enzyme
VAEFLRLRARSFVFTASPPPSVMATVLAALEVIEECPDLLKQLHENARYMKRGLAEAGFELEQTVTPIIPVLIGDDEKTFQLTGQLEAEGVLVNPVVPPAVPAEDSLIRVSIMASHSEDDLSLALEKFRKVGRNVGVL